MPIGSHSQYRAKRDPATTPEPMGGSQLERGRRFVVQHHLARREHWDLRLEHDGVLRSWAVPKGPSPDPADKRLAIETEPHPLEYTAFEGVIPEGNYGAGSMIVWDQGSYTPLEDFGAGYEKGKLLFELHGYKLQGRWTLVRTKQGWLLIKERDSHVRTGDAASYPPDSILSGLSHDELKAPGKVRRNFIARLRRAGARQGELPRSAPRPMLATAGKPFTHDDWLFELKYDGYRAFAMRKDGGEVRILSRNGNDLSVTYPDLVHALEHLPFTSFIIDGEIVCHDGDGMPSFNRLQRRAMLTRSTDVARAVLTSPATLYAFDLLHAEGHETQSLPLAKRKALLEAMLPSAGPVRYSEHIRRDGEAMYASVEKMGLEGVVGKRAQSSYQAGRSPDWVKVATTTEDDFVIVGWTNPKSAGNRNFAALVLASHVNGELTYVGRVGTGYSADESDAIFAEIKALGNGSPPALAPSELKAHWIEPRLVATIRYKQRTRTGHLRSPVFLHLRNDKGPNECGDYLAIEQEHCTTGNPVTITNPDKVLWPDDGYTKTDLVNYYRAISPWILPYLGNRPVVLVRFPDGIDKKSFFQKNAPPGLPEWIRTEHVYSKTRGDDIRYLLLESENALAWVANLAAIELHVWASIAPDLDRPSWTILDLDPKEASFADVVTVARDIRGVCREIGMPAYLKTSGSTGLHVLLPTGGRLDFDQSRSLATLIATVVIARDPGRTTLNRSLTKRDCKVYIDVGQNRSGQTIAAPFSVRARPGAPVSMPLRWEELSPKKSNAKFTIRNALRRVGRWQSDPLAGILDDVPDLSAAIRTLETLINDG